jgi:hypothetical protein
MLKFGRAECGLARLECSTGVVALVRAARSTGKLRTYIISSSCVNALGTSRLN